jgi:hypothetical protein
MIHRARVTACGFEQIDGKHYNEDDKAAPVASDITIRVMLVILIMASFAGHIMDVKGAFLLGDFNPKHKMYLAIPQGFEHFLHKDMVLLLLHTCMELSRLH